MLIWFRFRILTYRQRRIQGPIKHDESYLKKNSNNNLKTF